MLVITHFKQFLWSFTCSIFNSLAITIKLYFCLFRIFFYFFFAYFMSHRNFPLFLTALYFTMTKVKKVIRSINQCTSNSKTCISNKWQCVKCEMVRLHYKQFLSDFVTRRYSMKKHKTVLFLILIFFFKLKSEQKHFTELRK